MRPSDLIEKVVTASYLQILFQKVCSKLRLFDSILFLIKENLLQQNPMECRNKSSCWMEGFGAPGYCDWTLSSGLFGQ